MTEAGQEYWDDRYRGEAQLWSGQPNDVLVAEAADLPPGRALDVGCGEGADALWLAARGWSVTALDISQVAIDRAAASGGGTVTWRQADITVTPPPAAAFDLVSAQYFPLPREHPDALRGLLAAVAPGGTLLLGSHDFRDVAHHEHINPDDYYSPSEIAGMLGADWKVQVNETRPRLRPGPPGTHHVNDAVLRAVRLQ